MTSTTLERVAQNFANPEMTRLVISPAMKMGTKFVCLAGEEFAVIQVGRETNRTSDLIENITRWQRRYEFYFLVVKTIFL